jgi:hypothetical protein
LITEKLNTDAKSLTEEAAMQYVTKTMPGNFSKYKSFTYSSNQNKKYNHFS